MMYEQNENTLKIQKLKHEQSLRDVWDMIKQRRICIMGLPEGKERKAQKEYLNK